MDTIDMGTRYEDEVLQRAFSPALTEDGFMIRPTYMDTHLSQGLQCAISQIRMSSHDLEIETGRF